MDPERTSRLGFDRSAKAFVYLVAAVVGIAAGLLLPYVAGWVEDWGLGLPGPFGLLASFDSPWAVWGRPLVGLAAGLGFAAYIVYQSPVLHISSDEVVVTQRGNTRRIKRSDVAGIYRDGQHVVIESAQGRRLFRGEVEGGRQAVREAFVSRGYPWETD